MAVCPKAMVIPVGFLYINQPQIKHEFVCGLDWWLAFGFEPLFLVDGQPPLNQTTKASHWVEGS